MHPELRGDSCSIYSRPADAILGLETEDLAGRLADIFGTSGGAVAEPAVSEGTFWNFLCLSASLFLFKWRVV